MFCSSLFLNEKSKNDQVFIKIQTSKNMKILKRMQAPTPRFFKKVRTIGLTLAGLSATVLATPFAFPEIVVQAAGYLAIAGSVATAISQTATAQEDTSVTKERPERHQHLA
jgi:hypothetical protein